MPSARSAGRGCRGGWSRARGSFVQPPHRLPSLVVFARLPVRDRRRDKIEAFRPRLEAGKQVLRYRPGQAPTWETAAGARAVEGQQPSLELDAEPNDAPSAAPQADAGRSDAAAAAAVLANPVLAQILQRKRKEAQALSGAALPSPDGRSAERQAVGSGGSRSSVLAASVARPAAAPVARLASGSDVSSDEGEDDEDDEGSAAAAGGGESSSSFSGSAAAGGGGARHSETARGSVPALSESSGPGGAGPAPAPAAATDRSSARARARARMQAKARAEAEAAAAAGAAEAAPAAAGVASAPNAPGTSASFGGGGDALGRHPTGAPAAPLEAVFADEVRAVDAAPVRLVASSTGAARLAGEGDVSSDEDGSGGGSDSGSDSSSDSEGRVGASRAFRPVFRSRAQRTTTKTAEQEEEEEAAEEAKAKAEREARVLETRAMVAEEVMREAEAKAAAEAADAAADPGKPDDTDRPEDVDAEFEAWQARELARLRRDRDEEAERQREARETARRRAMTDEEREAENRALRAQGLLPAQEKAKTKRGFMQKFFHRGAFYMVRAVLEGRRTLARSCLWLRCVAATGMRAAASSCCKPPPAPPSPAAPPPAPRRTSLRFRTPMTFAGALANTLRLLLATTAWTRPPCPA